MERGPGNLDKLQDTINSAGDMDISSREASENESVDAKLEQAPDNNFDSDNTNTESASDVPLYVLLQRCEIYESPMSVGDHLLAFSTYATRHNISYTQFEHRLYLINIHLPDNNLLERNINKIKEMWLL